MALKNYARHSMTPSAAHPVLPDNFKNIGKGGGLFFLLRRHDHDHLTAFHLGKLLDSG
jgi:hypothetical protein